MRVWKDNENRIFHPKLAKFMLIMSIPGFLFGPVHLFLYHAIIWQDPVDFLGSMFIVYLVRFGGAYKLGRKYAEWKLRKRDNEWRHGR